MTRSSLGILSAGAFLSLAACAPPAAAPVPEVGAPVAGAATITPSDMYARVAFLASDALRGRDTPSQGLEAAAAYIASEYLKMGLEPAGEGGTYYQRYPFPLRRLRVEGTRFSVAGPGGEVPLVFGQDFVVLGGTRADIVAPLVSVGTGADMAPGLADVLRDKVAVFTLPGEWSRDVRILMRRQVRQAEEAGARAAVHILDPSWTEAQIAQLADRVVEPSRTLGDEIEFAQFLISYDAAEDVFAAADLSLDAVWQEAVGGEVEPVTLSGLTSTAGAPIEELERAFAPNVAAVLPGSDPKLRDEYVILSAHMDHVGVGEPLDGDSIYNGADDDASGTSGLLEVAEAFASLPERPRRSVIFLHVSGEEKGLLGSRWYSDHPTVPLEQVVANINVDMIGRNSPDSVVVIGKDYSSLGETVNAVGARHPELGLVVADDIWPEERFFFRSDHFNFARKEIPALFFFTGVHEDYHRPSDEVDVLNVEKAAEVSRLIFYTVQEIANDPTAPTWDPEGLEEVRALTR